MEKSPFSDRQPSHISWMATLQEAAAQHGTQDASELQSACTEPSSIQTPGWLMEKIIGDSILPYIYIDWG